MQDKLLDIADGTFKGDHHTKKEFQMPNKFHCGIIDQVRLLINLYIIIHITWSEAYIYSYQIQASFQKNYLPLQYKDINYI